ncbi:MlaC/ttg2D family ABC transporter substrate-binding protein [Sphingosinicella humi]|uniref:Toluene tolerance protein n=1 Tax=Allosphingosinicella humi TaxID=2068657 RepID=A0A2U2IYT5_9SPHN|nr:ABC transporter substrate-binding protein [Sphingosinicella humi]PWG01255.1 toluene tolerance protein [Sphingosinicella humi]
MRSVIVAAILAGSSIAAVPATAQVSNQDPGKFVQSLATTGFGVLKGDKGTARGKFRSLLAQHFAVDAIGDRLIRRWRPKISDVQYKAYKTAFPDFIVGTYADRLYDYSDADIKVVRVQNQGNSAAVLTQVTRPGARPVNAIWALAKVGGGYKVTNLTVGGVNIAVAQEADFNSYVQRNGFDALVNFMEKRG